MRVIALALLVFLPMIGETWLSARNTRRLLASGAVEPDRDVFRMMQIVYPACFAAMLAESAVRGPVASWVLLIGFMLFAAAKVLKYWAIATLGRRWSFRVLVPPGSHRVASGPYRVLRHPNYVGVAGELGSMAVMAGAPVTGVASLIGFGLLMRARVAIEEPALDAAHPHQKGRPLANHSRGG